MHEEGQGWGPLGGWCRWTHNSKISGHHDYLAKMHIKPLQTLVLFCSSHSSTSFFLLPCLLYSAVCMCEREHILVWDSSQRLSFCDHISLSGLFVLVVLCPDGFLAVVLYLTFKQQQWQQRLQGFYSALFPSSVCLRLHITENKNCYWLLLLTFSPKDMIAHENVSSVMFFLFCYAVKSTWSIL